LVSVADPLVAILPPVGVAQFLFALWRADLTTKPRIAAKVKQIGEIVKQSGTSNANRLLQEQVDSLVLRYAALTCIKFSRRDKYITVGAFLLMIAALLLYFLLFLLPLIRYGKEPFEYPVIPGFFYEWNDLIFWLIMGLGFQYGFFIAFFRFMTLKVNRELFILLDAPPLARFTKFSPPGLLQRPVRADSIYKVMLDLQSQAADRGPQKMPKRPLIDYLDDAIAKKHYRPAN
jgi:hypothetical protein